jgi:hypothetical protein
LFVNSGHGFSDLFQWKRRVYLCGVTIKLQLFDVDRVTWLMLK